MKLAEIVAATRRLLNDSDPQLQRWPDAAYYEAVHAAVLAVRRHRPDLITGRYAPVPVYTPADADLEPPLPDDWHPLLAYYAAGHLLLIEDPTEATQKATILLQHFRTELGR